MTRTVNLAIAPYRLLTKADAAHYCRRSVKTFEAQVPVRPIVMSNGDRLWDVVDLDAWIDGLKTGHDTADAILAKLG